MRSGPATVPHFVPEFTLSTSLNYSRPRYLITHLGLAPCAFSWYAMDTSNTPETTQAAANVPSHRSKQSPSLVGAKGDEHQAADTTLADPGKHAISHDDSTSKSPSTRASSATAAATGDKRKRGNDAGEPGDGIKRQMITLPFRGRIAAPPSYQEQ